MHLIFKTVTFLTLLQVTIKSTAAQCSTDLPAGCLNPSGIDCTFYRNCLETKINCGASWYALGYGEKFCKLFGQNLHRFSAHGQAWVNGVRKCLQQKLIPVLESCTPTNCNDIKSLAFKSHVPCYLSPAPRISICDLGCKDFALITATIKSSLLSDPLETLNAILKVVEGCPFNLAILCGAVG